MYGRFLPKCSNDAGGSGPADDSRPDIELLAKLLSQEAAKLRSSLGDGDVSAADDVPGGDSPASPSLSDRPLQRFSNQASQLEKAIMAELQDGGFLSLEFELLQQIGKLSVQQVAV